LSVTNAGAVTWGDGTSGITGEITLFNSLIGSSIDNKVGSGGVTVLSNGNYVVSSPDWDYSGSDADIGAVTWGNGTSGTTGTVSSSNSLIGSTVSDKVGSGGVTALTNGNYVVSSPDWDFLSVSDAGAVTWGNGTSGITGEITLSNSLLGASNGNSVGLAGVTALSNGNYVVSSPAWDYSGSEAGIGAVTWGNGASGLTGLVMPTNSLIGTLENDLVGYRDDGSYCCNGVTALSNGNFAVISQLWDNGYAQDAGAVTWGNGTSGIIGEITTSNSLVGSNDEDEIGYGGVTALSNGNYGVFSPLFDFTGGSDMGAVTWGDGWGATTGAISMDNSVIGGVEYGGLSMVWTFDARNNQLVVGRPDENIVTLFRFDSIQYLPLLMR
jgi:hypothetical protein